ncbi:MAG: DUF1778 domain-containing protein [Campylobacterota bacterium]|nr:DUF1778 domain-containing protein [Campylobacterota bacterium]
MQTLDFTQFLQSDSPKDARFEAKINSSLKEFLQGVASMQGLDLSGFVISAALEKARKVVSSSEIIYLTEEEHKDFMNILMNPPKATSKLKELMAMDSLNER